MKTTVTLPEIPSDPLFIFRMLKEDFDIHIVPHSLKARAAILRKAKAKNMSLEDYLIDEIPLLLIYSEPARLNGTAGSRCRA